MMASTTTTVPTTSAARDMWGSFTFRILKIADIVSDLQRLRARARRAVDSRAPPGRVPEVAAAPAVGRAPTVPGTDPTPVRWDRSAPPAGRWAAAARGRRAG